MVDTGDPMPTGRDAAVMREHVRSVEAAAGVELAPGAAGISVGVGVEGMAAGAGVEIAVDVPPYQHVRSIGEDVSTGELLLPTGHRQRAVDVAAAAAAGATDLAVRRRPASPSSRPATRSSRSGPIRSRARFSTPTR